MTIMSIAAPARAPIHISLVPVLLGGTPNNFLRRTPNPTTTVSMMNSMMNIFYRSSLKLPLSRIAGKR
jgi:hypothetical protein